MHCFCCWSFIQKIFVNLTFNCFTSIKSGGKSHHEINVFLQYIIIIFIHITQKAGKSRWRSHKSSLVKRDNPALSRGIWHWQGSHAVIAKAGLESSADCSQTFFLKRMQPTNVSLTDCATDKEWDDHVSGCFHLTEMSVILVTYMESGRIHQSLVARDNYPSLRWSIFD